MKVNYDATSGQLYLEPTTHDEGQLIRRITLAGPLEREILLATLNAAGAAAEQEIKKLLGG